MPRKTRHLVVSLNANGLDLGYDVCDAENESAALEIIRKCRRPVSEPIDAWTMKKFRRFLDELEHMTPVEVEDSLRRTREYRDQNLLHSVPA